LPIFLAFTPWTWWALPAGLTVAVGAVLVWVPARAEVFADLVEASFDLYRGALYTQLRWPLPGNPAEERVTGRRVTTYLMRGLTGNTPTFTAEPPPAVAPAPAPTPAAAPAAAPAALPGDGDPAVQGEGAPP
jgi:hypothetical protein